MQYNIYWVYKLYTITYNVSTTGVTVFDCNVLIYVLCKVLLTPWHENDVSVT